MPVAHEEYGADREHDRHPAAILTVTIRAAVPSVGDGSKVRCR